MGITRNAVAVLLASTVLAGCSGLQKSDWPTCAAVGGVTGAALGAIKNSGWAGAGAGIGAGMGAAYCWVHGASPQEVEVVEEVVVEEEVVYDLVSVELDVWFDFDQAVVKPSSYPDIQALATFMHDYPGTATTVEGFTDSIGTELYNQALSERRASAVRDVLVNKFGVSSARVRAVGYGESRPIADNNTAEGRALNRRVEAQVQAQQ